jgi:hypothetical protein
MMSSDPDVDAKLNTKTHLYTTFFIILLFRARLVLKFAKSVNMTPNILFLSKFQNGCQKTQNLMLISKSC